ncbi:MAG: 30S ribosomal protein S6 [Armatimonadota bacterium]|nr:30S ribosomal protein S6 [Armatimonadota bacterium]MDW8155028.1 30S ribosomal protein S6 [Armatimonadota bacterium]
MRKAYEIVFILRPDLDDQQVQAAIDRVAGRITERGGTLLATEPWGKRRLAYPIARHREGFYVLMRFELDGQRVQDLKNAVGLQEEVIRFLVCEAVPTAPAAVPAQAEAVQPVPSGGGDGGC